MHNCWCKQISCHSRVMKSVSMPASTNYRKASYTHFILSATIKHKGSVTLFLNNRHRFGFTWLSRSGKMACPWNNQSWLSVPCLQHSFTSRQLESPLTDEFQIGVKSPNTDESVSHQCGRASWLWVRPRVVKIQKTNTHKVGPKCAAWKLKRWRSNYSLLLPGKLLINKRPEAGAAD